MNSARQGSGPRPGAESVGLTALVFLAYALGALLSWQTTGAPTGPSFFPSAGVTLAALLLSRRSLWPAVVVAAVLGASLVDLNYGTSPLNVAGFALANVIGSLTGAALVLAWCRGTPDLRQRRDLALFVLGGCLVGPAVGGLIGGGLVALTTGTGWPGWLTHAIGWFVGDGVGTLVIATPMLLWPRQSRILRRRPVETAVLLIAAALLASVAFWTAIPSAMLVLPVVAWAALRLDMLGTALAGAVTALVAAVTNVAATLPAFTQGFLAVTILVGLLIAQESGARTKAVREREGERRERIRLDSLAGLAQRLSAAISPDDIADALVSHLINEAGATTLNLGLLSPDRKMLEWFVLEGYPPPVIQVYGRGVPVSETTAATDVARTGRPVLLRSRADFVAAYPDRAHWLAMSDAQSLIGWPLTSGSEPVGALMLSWAEVQPFDDAQLAYVSAVAAMVSQALVRAQIYADQHVRAAVLQSAVLPTGAVDTDGLDIAVAYEPAAGGLLAGDWYDTLSMPDDRTYFAVGDVVGHGLPAVEDMAQLRSAGRVFAHQGLTPARLLAELNGFTRTVSHGKFARMAVAILDSGGLAYGSAGGPPPLLRRALTGEVIRLSDADGPVLGTFDDPAYPEGRVAVASGDILVMYTDGLVKSQGADPETGIAAAERVIAGWDASTALSDGCDALVGELARRPRVDDVCIVAVRFPT